MRYEVTPSDLEVYGRWLLAETSVIERQFGHGWIWAPVAGVVALLAIRPFSLGGMLLVVILGGIAWGMLWSRSKAAAKQNIIGGFLKGDAGRGAVGLHDLTLAEDGVHEQRPQGRVFHQWGSVRRIVGHEGAVYLMVGEESSYIVPASAFSSADVRAEFIATANRLRSQWQPRGEA